jgi:zinc protease
MNNRISGFAGAPTSTAGRGDRLRRRTVRGLAVNPLFRFVLIACLIALSSAWVLAADKAHLTVLPNGLRVVTQEMHSAPVVSTHVYYHVGSRNECTGITGISHFIEHMLFKGTSQFPPGEASRLITRTGGWDNGYTWLDFTAYVETLPAAHLDLALRIEADRMAHATFAPPDVKSEKTVVLSELEGDENDPGFYLGNAVDATAFMAHPYHSPTIGWKSDVVALDRQKALDYYHSFYAPNNATLVIVGDFVTNKTLDRVRELFGPIPARSGFREVVTVEPPQQGERRVTVRRPGAAGTIEMAFHAVRANHPDHYALDVVETVLGTGRTSRLYRALVDKKLAVSAEASNYTNLDPGLFQVDITLAQGVDHRTVEQAALAEIDKLASELITERELQRAKNQAKASFVYGTDSVSSLGSMLGYFDVVANYRLLYEYANRIERVTREQVREAVRQYLGADNRTIGWFIPTGEAPSGPAARPGPVSRYGAAAPPTVGARFGNDGAATPLPSRPALSLPNGERAWERVHGEGSYPHLNPLPARERSPVGATAAPSRKPIRFQLPNGAIFIVYENPVAPAISIRGMVGAGLIFNPADKPGLANFVAEMLSRGAAGRSWRDIAESLEFVAADVDVSGGIQVGNISGRCLKNDLAVVMQTLADEVRRPDFPPDQVDLVRSQLQVALQEAAQDTGAVAERELYATLYPVGHPLHYRPLGTPEGIAAITRDDLVNFHSRYYRPDTVILAVAGDVTEATVRELAEKCFGDWQASGERPAIVIPDIQPPAQAIRKTIPLAGKTQSDIAIGLPGVSRLSPDYYAAELLNYVLGGGGFASRLMTRIRDEQGLAYYVYSYFGAYRGAGPWMLRMGVNPARVEQAVTSAFAELGRINRQPPNDHELQLWKDYVTGTLALSLETNAGIAASLSDAEFYGLGLDYPWRYPEIIRKLMPAEVAIAGRKYITPDRAITIIAGPESTGRHQ